MFSSLRTKLTLSMLITSLAAISVMALVSPLLLEQRFEDLTRKEQLNQLTRLMQGLREQQPDWGTVQSARKSAERLQQRQRQTVAQEDKIQAQLKFANLQQLLAGYVLTDHHATSLTVPESIRPVNNFPLWC